MLKSRIILAHNLELHQDYELSGESFEALQLWKPHRGEIFTVQDVSHSCFRARLIELSDVKAIVRIFEKTTPAGGAELEIILHQALPEKERMEWIIQKTTELGVHTIVPIKSQKSISPEDRECRQKKIHCWPRVALRAAKQCRRPDIPQILPFCSFQESLRLAQQSRLRIMLWEKQTGQFHLKNILNQNDGAGKISIMVGPEGGFTEQEVILARQAGYEPVRLGPHILRTETASVVILSILQFILGSMK